MKKLTLTQSAINIKSNIIYENELPYPYVYYPPSYGAFFSFSKSKEDKPIFCLCSQDAIKNLIEIKLKFYYHLYTTPPNWKYIARSDFHEYWIEKYDDEIIEPNDIRYEEKICHRCNLKTPYLNYCHPMYGGNFKQKYGWYIKQNKYKLGLYYVDCLDNAPDEIKDICSKLKINDASQRKYQIENQIYSDNDISISQQLYKDRSKLRRKLDNIIENVTRKDFGMRKIGDGWISESILYNMVKQIYPDETILRNYRPEWLNKLELDIYLPDKNLAFEYQGYQHFKPMDIWGGQVEFEKLQERDNIKKELCRKLNINLIEFYYTEPLLVDYLKSKIHMAGIIL